MSGPEFPHAWPGVPPLQTSTDIAPLARRFAALLIDGILVLVLIGVGFTLSGLAGAWRFDDEWLRQYDANPSAWPAIPPFHVDLNVLLVVAVVLAVALTLGGAWCWSRFAATPGQSAMGIRLFDYETGKPLSLGAAMRRSLATLGVFGVMLVFYSLLSFERLATMAINDTSSELLPPGTPLDPWLDVMSGAIFLATMWFIALAVSTISNRQRRGIHDRIGGSIAIHVRRWVAWPAAMPGGFVPQPGWTPPGAWAPPGSPGRIEWGSPPAATPPGPPEPPNSAPQPPPGWAAAPNPAPWKSFDRDASKLRAGSETASVNRRAAAYLLDSGLVLALFLGAYSALAPDGRLTSETLGTERLAILAGLAGGAIQLVYFVLGWTLWKGSLGQRMVGISVVLETDGSSLSAMDAIVRWAVIQGPFALATIVPLAISPVVSIVAGGWSLFLLYSTRADANCQGIHDHFLKTKVVVA